MKGEKTTEKENEKRGYGCTETIFRGSERERGKVKGIKNYKKVEDKRTFACNAGGPGFDSRLRRIYRVSQRTVASELRMLSDALCRGCRWPWSSPYIVTVRKKNLNLSKNLLRC